MALGAWIETVATAANIGGAGDCAPPSKTSASTTTSPAGQIAALPRSG
jgi:hypothetical protein